MVTRRGGPRKRGQARVGAERLLIAVLAGGVLSACEDGPSTPSHRHEAATVRVQPATLVLSAGTEGHLNAIGLCGCGAEIGQAATWTSSDASVATVSPTGAVTALAFGTTTIRAVVTGLEATATVTVLPRGVVIGPDGGTVASTDGVAVLEVPAGALAEPTDVVIEALADAAFLDEMFFVPSTAYRVHPWGAQLQTRARLRIRYDPTRVPDGVDPNRLRLQMRVPFGWSEAAEHQHRVQTREVEGAVAVFGTFALLAQPNGVVLGPPGGLIAASDGAWELEIPPGALADWTDVSVSPAPHGIYDALPTYVPGTAWGVKPSLVELAVPARLRIRYDPARIPFGVDPDRLLLLELDWIYPRLIETHDNQVNRVEHWVEGWIDRFSRFAVLGEMDGRE